MAAVVDEYVDGHMETDDIFPCKGCGEILEEGKAFELAGNRWHLDCFRCNTCQTLLDSDANLLLLGDGSLICNNCTYSCSACGNKIEDLAILTGDQAFCSTCFRCRNCKRKIENLRYARTSQGIFCMDCHETLLARRKKKSRAAAAAKSQRQEGSSPLVKDKLLPALPPQMTGESSVDERLDGEQDAANDSTSRQRAGSRAADTTPRASIPARSPERPAPPEAAQTKSDNLMLPSSTYRKNRNSAIIGPAEGKVEPAELYGSLGLDTNSTGTATPSSANDKKKEHDYFTISRSSGSEKVSSQASTPHIAFQASSNEIGRTPPRRLSKSDKPTPEGESDFKMTDISKTRALVSSRSNSLSAAGTPEIAASSKFSNGPPPRKRPEAPSRSSHDGTSDDATSAITSPDLSKNSLKLDLKPAVTRKELPPTASSRGSRSGPDSYVQPRAAPAPPSGRHSAQAHHDSETPSKASPKLPNWTSGADFSLDEDMARILGTDEGSSSLLRRVSNVVRHGRSGSTESYHNHPNRISHSRSISETTRSLISPRWPKSPIDDANPEVMSPMSIKSAEEAAILKRQLRNSENRVAELEKRFDTEKDLHNLTKSLHEKRKTVSALDTQTELMIKQLEVLSGYVERAKATKTPIDPRDLEESAIREFVQRLEAVKQAMSSDIEELHEKRTRLLEERDQAIADRDRALMEFEQLSSKNAQLADMNNDLTHQIQGRFKSQVNDLKGSNGLGIYSNRGSGSMINMDAASISTGPTLMGGDEDTIVEAGPTVVQVRKGQVKKFNWKKGSKTMAQNVAKGVNRAVVAFQNDRERIQQQGLVGENIGMPYNATVAQAELISTPNYQNGSRQGGLDAGRHQGFGFFGKKAPVTKSTSANAMVSTPAAIEPPSVLFGSDLSERADFEHRQIPSVVTRCIEEVELRGMDQEGIYRKTGGNSQVNQIKDGFDKDENYDISDTDMDITAVTSVLKQYFRRLPEPLLTFDVYERILESNAVSDETERCTHLRKTFSSMPQSHRDCLEFLMFHLRRVAEREPENLMSPKNLAVVFAPTIMRDLSIEREMTDMHAKNIAVQFVIENSDSIFEDV